MLQPYQRAPRAPWIMEVVNSASCLCAFWSPNPTELLVGMMFCWIFLPNQL